ncbi:MAG: hypothetical protein ACRDFB_09795 [Rhabdochlamydiaceae bacterium]
MNFQFTIILNQIQSRKLIANKLFNLKVNIEKTLRTFIQKYGWFPEKQEIKTTNGRVTVVIPLPDHISLAGDNLKF